MYSSQIVPRVPSIAIDLDGVVWYSGRLIEGTKESIELLSQDLCKVDPIRYNKVDEGVQMPFFFLTNSGANTEQTTANIINQKIGLPKNQQVTAEHFILNFTPLRQEMKKYQDKIVLVSGFDNTTEIFEDCGIKQFITIIEYAKIYPQLVPNNNFSKHDQTQTKQIVRKRLQLEDDSIFDKYIQVHAIFLSYISTHLEIITQIVIDVLSTEDGNIAQNQPDKAPDTHIPVYSVANDYFFPGKDIHLSRLGFGMFLDAICDIFKKTYKKDLQILRCGKPSLMTFQYCQDKSQEIALRNNLNLSHIYMIGDNPHTDIKGAKQLGWQTILVRTGVYKGQVINDPEELPDKIVQNLKEAIQYIYEKEGIRHSL